ncbi:MAG: YbjN domain-containing protein [Kineosporiaceae bacterium]|nr:YbjN domain-containing protein [Kineosporiaceae bacterium]MBK7623177.1 YbjN domain-containing protein [Kineosporiaceae bacterium]MBK8074871.1 YbjN domain-containing protein [Kineosporiaceae bacterium]
MTAAARAERTAAARAVVEAWLAGSGLEHELGARTGEYVVKLPGETKLATTASVLVGDQSLSVSAFVVRRPDENHEAFYRWLLARNLRLPGVAFALDALGDVFLVGKLPLDAVTDEAIDHLLGAVLTVADSSFNDLLVLGFLESMRREWRWRIDRGESTRNLDAFKHLLQDAAPEPSGQSASPGERETHTTISDTPPNG